MKRFLIIFAWVAFAVLLSTASWAEDPMTTAVKQFAKLFVQLKPIVYVCGAFGLLSIAVAAFFGKMDWSRLTFVGLALTTLAMTGAIVDYMIGNEEAKIDWSFAATLEDTDPLQADFIDQLPDPKNPPKQGETPPIKENPFLPPDFRFTPPGVDPVWDPGVQV